MYFLRASYKSPQMFLAGYFIGASDRWSRWNKKMVCSSPSSSFFLFKNFFSLKCIVKSPFPFPFYFFQCLFCTSYWTQVKIYITVVLFNTYQELFLLSALQKSIIGWVWESTGYQNHILLSFLHFCLFNFWKEVMISGIPPWVK